MNVPVRSDGKVDLSTLEGNVRNYLVANPFENTSEFTADLSELKELIKYFGNSDDLNFNYIENGGKYEIKFSAKL